LSEDFIREFQDKVGWHCISTYQKLSEKFIREFQDKVNWHYISYYQKLSENFIEEFKDKVNWNNISYSQKLSEDFIIKFKNKINWELLLRKFRYKLEFFIDKYQIKYNNYCSDLLDFQELINLTLRLISLKAFS
jgi:hypothetical protein